MNLSGMSQGTQNIISAAVDVQRTLSEPRAGFSLEEAQQFAAQNPVSQGFAPGGLNTTQMISDTLGLDPTTQALLSIFDRIPRGMNISDVFQSIGEVVDAAGLTSDNESATQIGRGAGSLANGNPSGLRDIANGAGLNLPFMNMPG